RRHSTRGPRRCGWTSDGIRSGQAGNGGGKDRCFKTGPCRQPYVVLGVGANVACHVGRFLKVRRRDAFAPRPVPWTFIFRRDLLRRYSPLLIVYQPVVMTPVCFWRAVIVELRRLGRARQRRRRR